MSVTLPFNEAKATEAAAYLLKLSGAPMSYIKLIKLLYLVDREALLVHGRPVTTDQYVQTDQGPSLSQISDLITVDSFGHSVWSDFISPLHGELEVELRREAPPSELSEAEAELIESVFVNFGGKSWRELIEFSRTLPEWTNPRGTKIPLDYADILKAHGLSPSEVAVITSELESLAAVTTLLEPWHSDAIPT